MPKITNRVLTAKDQGLDTRLQKNARENIDAMRRLSGATQDNIVTVGANGEVKDSRVNIQVFRDAQADWAETVVDNPHYIKNKPEQLLADARVESDVLYIDKLYGGETVEFAGMSEEERAKLEGIEEGAEVNAIVTVKVNGSALAPDSDRAVDVDLSGYKQVQTPVRDPSPHPTEKAVEFISGISQDANGVISPVKKGIRQASASAPGIVQLQDSVGAQESETGKAVTPAAVSSFVNSSIATNTANFLGTLDVVSDLGLTTSATNGQIAEALDAYAWPAGVTVTNNDYAFVSVDDPGTSTDSAEYRRFKYSEAGETPGFSYEYTLNNSSFTQAQWDAVNSGITSAKVSKLDALPEVPTPSNAPSALMYIGSSPAMSWVQWTSDTFDIPVPVTGVEIGGRFYRTVTIGNQEWLAENLDYKAPGITINPSQTLGSAAAWYYNKDEETYGIDGTRKCGLLYNWYAVSLMKDNAAELLPDGWHVPTSNEVNALATAVGGTATAGTKLKAKDVSWAESWGGTDDYGFNMLPSGYAEGASSHKGVGSWAYLWTTTSVRDVATAWHFNKNNENIIKDSTQPETYAYSVRLVRTIT